MKLKLIKKLKYSSFYLKDRIEEQSDRSTTFK